MFHADWKDSVIWAHYSAKHSGLCLGFEIPMLNGDPKSNAGPVSYISSPLPFPPNFEEMSEPEHDAFARKAIFTKFEHWLYEKEIRVWGPLENEDNGLHFRALWREHAAYGSYYRAEVLALESRGRAGVGIACR